MHRLVIALVTLLGLTAGSIVAGYLLLLSGTPDRLAAMAPAGTAAYVNLYLNPSVGQQLNLEALIGRLPGFADEASLDAKVDQIIGNLLAGTGIDYEAEVKPWLGDQLAVAAWPGADGASEAVVLVAVKDAPAAAAAVSGLIGGETTEQVSETYRGIDVRTSGDTAFAIVDDVLVIGPLSESLQPVIDVAQGAGSLGGLAAFGEAMARVPSDHLASAFLNVGALTDGGAGSGESVTTASAALIAESEGLRLTGSLPFEGAGDGPAIEPSVATDWIAADALAAAVIFDLPQTLEAAEGALSGSDQGEEALSLLDTIRALAAFGLGLDVDADLMPLLDREAGVAITGLADGVPRGHLILRPADPEAADAALDRILDRVAAIGAESRSETREGVEITVVTVPDLGEIAYAKADGIVIAGLSVDDVLAAVGGHEAEDGSLSNSPAYLGAFGLAGEQGGTQAFANLGALIELGVLAEAGVGLPNDARDILSQLGAFGISFLPRADFIEFHAAITVPDGSAE